MKRQDGTFQEDIQCIIQPIHGKGAIFISNIQAAQNHNTLNRFQIGAVITAAKGKNLAHTMPRHIQYLYIPAIDHQSFDISQYFDTAYQLLKQELKRTNVLVHCMAGVSRSATLVIAFLMRSRQIGYQEAFNLVKRRRKIISPNSAFLEQLQQYETKVLPSCKKLQNQSTSSSWYSPKTAQVERKGDSESEYDKRLQQSVHNLFLLRANRQVK